MALLDIDTDILRSTVSVAEQTNELISEALNLLNQVVIHNDWACKERYQINEYTLQNRQRAQELKSHTSSFYQAIKQASEQFDQVEQSNVQRTNNVDGLLAQILSVVPGMSDVQAGAQTGGIADIAMTSFDTIKDSLRK